MDDDDRPHQGFVFTQLVVGLIGILCGAIIVVAFHCIAMGWCSPRRSQSSPTNRPSQTVQPIREDRSSSSNSSSAHLITVHKYTDKESTCAVCLGEFTEGDEVRVLPECAHSFHVSCIDLWLHSHSNCPLCRARAVSMPPPPHVVVALPSSVAVTQPEVYVARL